ncbi:MAG: hypothetical protein U5L04_16360 [Trueperaceae bacterium]|nr:hypothetical protein [Trueperaceae bacterium]
MTLQQTLSDIITNLPDWSARQLNEAQTSQAVVLRVLQALGYDIWNPFEVIPEETADSGNKPDFIVAIDSKPRFVVEVKRLGRDLDNRAKIQAVNYANNKGIRWAVLTDGSSWLLFDSFMQRPAQDRLILTLALHKQSVQVLANALGRLLHAEVWDQDDVDTYIDRTARDIQNNLHLSAQLEPLAETLQAFMDEMTIQEPEKGIELAYRLEKWRGEDYQLVEDNKKLFLNIFESLRDEDKSQEGREQVAERDDATSKTPDARIPVVSVENADLAQVLRRGVEQTIAQEPSSRSSPIDVWIGGEPIKVRNWRDVYGGIAEAYLLLGQAEDLEVTSEIYESMEQGRRKGSGEVYPPSSYRRLSNGKHLYANHSAIATAAKSQDLLRGLNAPSGMIRVIYKDEEQQLP